MLSLLWLELDPWPGELLHAVGKESPIQIKAPLFKAKFECGLEVDNGI